jgi:mycolic acid cyclopropane synthetase
MISTTSYIEQFATEFLTIKYVFPGGSVPSLPRTLELLDHYGLHVVDVEELSWHYQHTAEHWLNNFEAHWPTIQAIDRLVFTDGSAEFGITISAVSSKGSGPMAAISTFTISHSARGRATIRSTAASCIREAPRRRAVRVA